MILAGIPRNFRRSFQTSRCTGPCDNPYFLLLSGLGSLFVLHHLLVRSPITDRVLRGTASILFYQTKNLEDISWYNSLSTFKADFLEGWLIKDEIHKANKDSLQSYPLLFCYERAKLLCVIFMRCPSWENRSCSGVTTAWNAARAQGTADKATGSELNGIKFKILCVSCLIVLRKKLRSLAGIIS